MTSFQEGSEQNHFKKNQTASREKLGDFSYFEVIKSIVNFWPNSNSNQIVKKLDQQCERPITIECMYSQNSVSIISGCFHATQ